ncbi:hypothetical protein [Streptomyces hoynatensis]|nr:hypothetical protein [Streptomyces hoynatensis]
MEQGRREEEPEVYVPPVLAEAGGFADNTKGPFGDLAEGRDIYYQTW